MKNLIQKYRESYAGLPREAWWLAWVVFINRCGMMVVFFMTLYLTRKLGFGLRQAGQIMSIWGIGSLFGSYFGGWLCDRWGTYKVQVYSLIWNGVGFIVLGQMDRFETIALTIFLVAVVGEAFRPANITAFTEICPPDIRARGIVLNRLAANLGIAFGPAVGGFLARIDYGLIFWVDGLTCLAAAGLFYSLFRNSQRLQPEPEATAAAAESPWHDGLFMGVMGLLLVLAVVFFQIFNTWTIYLREINRLLENEIGLLLTINCILLVLFEMPVIHRLERLNPIPVVMAGIVFLFGGFFLLPFCPHYLYVAMTVVLWTIGEMLVFPLIATFIANRADDSVRGRYMGVFTLTFSMAFVVAPLAGSMAYTRLGPRPMWLSTGLIGAVVWLGFFYVNKRLIRVNGLKQEDVIIAKELS
ncbi:MFS transporter [bacterium]|nr:MFS transporter [bacterium]